VTGNGTPPSKGTRPGWRPGWREWTLLAVPLSLAASWSHQSATLVFVVAAAAIIPLAGYMGEATEHLASHSGPAIGGLLNATFGNAAELIIGIVALRAGLIDLVKASIIGSILGNLLLILGLAIIAGSLRKTIVPFNRTAAGVSATMLALAVLALTIPALFHGLHPDAGSLAELHLSEAVAVILVVTYLLSLLFSLKTHKALFGGEPHPVVEGVWSRKLAFSVLAVATVGVAVVSEVLVEAVEPMTHALGLSHTFVGLIVIPIVGNAAEHSAAVMVALKGKMDLAFQIALGSSTQIALLVAPLLILAGIVLGTGMDLVFEPFQVILLGLATAVVALITLDGETHWFEGVQLLAVYAMIAVAVFFI
jgi:Ca2+:H+ antiporter